MCNGGCDLLLGEDGDNIRSEESDEEADEEEGEEAAVDALVAGLPLVAEGGVGGEEVKAENELSNIA